MLLFQALLLWPGRGGTSVFTDPTLPLLDDPTGPALPVSITRNGETEPFVIRRTPNTRVPR